MLEHVFINLNLCCIQWYKFCVCEREGFKRYSHTHLPCASWSWNVVYFMGSQLHIWCVCHNTFTYPCKLQSLLLQWFTYHVHIGGRMQEIRVDKVTHAQQNHKTKLTSQAYSSKSNAPHVRIFRKHRNRSLIWCKFGLDNTLRSCAMGAWMSPISDAWNWTRLLQRSHIPTGAVAVVSTAVWTLDHLKYTYREGLVVRMNTAWKVWCRNLPSGTALSLCDNRITPIIITHITGRCDVYVYKIRILALPPQLASSPGHSQILSRSCEAIPEYFSKL